MRRLVLIDGNAILHRAFYALPETLTLKDGSPVNAVYGFTSMLLKVVEDLNPRYLICAFDLPKPTFREKLYADYRAQRPPTPKKLISQVKPVKNVVRAFKIPIYEVEGYEADDVIGTLASLAAEISNSKSQVTNKFQIPNLKSQARAPISEKNHLTMNERSERQPYNHLIMETIIVTGDRDLLQLVDKRIKVYLPVKGLSQAKLYGEEEVKEKYGVKPSQLVDYKALVGDPSDNYPGIKGIGPKTAAELIKRFDTLENVYQNIVKNRGGSALKFYNSRIKKALLEYKQDALLAKKLAKIVTDVPLALTLENAKLGKLDNPAVESLFHKLAFKTLWQRIRQMSASVAANRSSESRPRKERKGQNDQLMML